MAPAATAPVLVATDGLGRSRTGLPEAMVTPSPAVSSAPSSFSDSSSSATSSSPDSSRQPPTSTSPPSSLQPDSTSTPSRPKLPTPSLPPAHLPPSPFPKRAPGGSSSASSTSSTSSTASTASTASTSFTTTAAAKPQYNTRHLGLRLAADAASGFTAAALVAPIIAIIDRSIMENASGANSLAGSLRASFATLVRRPQQILWSKPFGLICLLYGSTYFTANAVDTATSTAHNRPASHVTAGAAKFAASSATNIGVCIYKDQVFVRMFGPPGAVPRPVPLPSYLLFALRDCMTIFASFNIPPRLGPYLDDKLGLGGEAAARQALSRAVSGLAVAQFAAPALTQFASTPVHLLGLDLYNRPWQASGPAGHANGPATWADRFAAVRRNWLVSSLARIGRIVPAFGVGGVVNMKMRKSLMTPLE
ncbi:hypothetical protein SPBR_07359 [Sporothrix brasiliensis 5110]|uniref:Sequence orphan n=1 Tax=Sporothrix brasiliensis 5110 TaxID=1398154 RepID=A0A0C2IV16_9PEZI|nr:uncharacterized protein SPBR_07359 [Sporothrix brasiliensis 5110]KIH88847.1 hypothetical protein SPBR_07359 [Sporothrix brasiliensis 5110]